MGDFPHKLLTSLIILAVGLIIAKIALHMLKSFLKKSNLDAVLYRFVYNAAKVIFIIVIVMTILSTLGVPTTTMITIIGAVGAAIALAMQNSLSNFAGGVLIMVTRPFRQGNLIEVQGHTGRVQHIDLMYSTLITLDNTVINIPNGTIVNNPVKNYSYLETRRIDVTVGISFDNTIEEARKAVMRVVEPSDYYLSDPKPVVGCREHGDSSIVLDVMVWCKTDDYYSAKWYLMEAIRGEFERSGINIPYPQLDVHMN